MISVKVFLDGVQAIVNLKPTYRSGGKGRDGTCDCIALAMGVIALGGAGGHHQEIAGPCRALNQQEGTLC